MYLDDTGPSAWEAPPDCINAEPHRNANKETKSC